MILFGRESGKTVSRDCDVCGKTYTRKALYIGRYCDSECKKVAKSAQMKEFRSARIKAGLCVRCGDQVEGSKRKCKACLVKNGEENRMKRDSNRSRTRTCCNCGAIHPCNARGTNQGPDYKCAVCNRWEREGKPLLKKSVTDNVKKVLDNERRRSGAQSTIAGVLVERKFYLVSELIDFYFKDREDYTDFKELCHREQVEETHQAIDLFMEAR